MPAIPRQTGQNALLDFYERPLASRSSLLPVGTYQNPDGTESAGWAWPQMALDAREAAEVPGHLLSGDPAQAMSEDDLHRTGLNVAGLMMGGGLLAPRPTNALAAVGKTSVEGSHPGFSILRDGEPVGRAYVREYPNTIQLGNIALDPAHQGQGIMTEVQKILAEKYGKPTVPDYLLSTNEMKRWQKNDPAAVADYVPMGEHNFQPRMASDGYYAASGSGPAPGTRAASGEIFSNGSKGGAGVGMGLLESQQPKGITAWHGSPHDFDQFDMSKIGTGEGAQAYGHGLYFADNEGVAKGYRDRLAGDNIEARNLFTAAGPLGDAYSQRMDAAISAARPFVQHPDHAKAVAGNIMNSLKELGGKPASSYLSEYEAPRGWEPAYQAASDALGDVRYQHNPGYTYQSRINADPEHFLDWDKPLSQQNDAVRKFAEGQGIISGEQEMYVPLGPEEWTNLLRDRYGVDNLFDAPRDKWSEAHDLSSRPVISNYDPKGGKVFEDLAGGDAHYSDELIPLLRDAGIPGIRYLDGGSRGAGEGSSNYVLFDDSLAKIVHKWRGDEQLYSGGSKGGAGVSAAMTQPSDPATVDEILARFRY